MQSVVRNRPTDCICRNSYKLAQYELHAKQTGFQLLDLMKKLLGLLAVLGLAFSFSCVLVFAADGKTLVVFYSASGNTKQLAQYITNNTGADLFELEPAVPYTDADLNYRDNDSRVCKEHEDKNRHVELIANTVENWAEYDTVFIGYPIWWGIAAWPVDTFVKANDFTGKIVIPFCTAGGSGVGESDKLLKYMVKGGDWKDGTRFLSRVSNDHVARWLSNM